MKFSVITATLNSERYLEECILHTQAQRPVEFEHILVDGGSTDDTLEIASRYPHLTIIRRTGCSIYEAWNIGLDIATGQLVGFCNSDDYYAPNTFERVIQQAGANPEAWMFSGKAIQFAQDGLERQTIAQYSDKRPKSLNFDELDVFGPTINARFLTRKLLLRFGKFDTRLRLASDCSYMMNVALAQVPVAFVDEVFYYYRSHPESSSLGGNPQGSLLALDEKLRIGIEFIQSGRMQTRELRHLRRAMAAQLVSTVIECCRSRRWKDAAVALKRWWDLPLVERAALVGKAPRFFWGILIRGFRSLSPMWLT